MQECTANLTHVHTINLLFTYAKNTFQSNYVRLRPVKRSHAEFSICCTVSSSKKFILDFQIRDIQPVSHAQNKKIQCKTSPKVLKLTLFEQPLNQSLPTNVMNMSARLQQPSYEVRMWWGQSHSLPSNTSQRWRWQAYSKLDSGGWVCI